MNTYIYTDNTVCKFWRSVAVEQQQRCKKWVIQNGHTYLQVNRGGAVTINRKHKVTRRTQNPPPGLRAYRVVTAVDRGPAPGLVTAMKSEAAVGADQRSAPHSSPGVLMTSDNTGGDRRALARCSAGLLMKLLTFLFRNLYS